MAMILLVCMRRGMRRIEWLVRLRFPRLDLFLLHRSGLLVDGLGGWCFATSDSILRDCGGGLLAC